jgi:hypothetical protein
MDSKLCPAAREEPTVTVSFEPTRHGWAQVETVIGERRSRIAVACSASKDPLATMLRIAGSLVAQRRRAHGFAAACRFAYLGGEWVLDLWGRTDHLFVVIYWTQDGRDDRPRPVFQEECSAWRYCAAWAREATRLRRELGVEGYQARTSGVAFPAAELASLNRALAVVTARPLDYTRLRAAVPPARVG